MSFIFWSFPAWALVDMEAQSAYRGGFEQHLLVQADPNLRAYGVYAMSFSTSEKINPLELISVLEKVLVNDALNERSVSLLAHACAQQLLIDQCPYEVVFEQLIDVAPDNFNSYWLPLNQAIKKNDLSLVRSILGQMKQVTRVMFWQFFGTDYEEALDTYAASHPIPQDVIDFEVKELYERSRKNETEMKFLSQHMPQYWLLMFKIISNMAMPVPEFSSVHEFCLANSAFWDDCLAVAEVLVKIENVSVAQYYGHVLQFEMLEALSKPERAKQAMKKYLQSMDYYVCLSGLADDKMDIFDMNLERQHQVRMFKAEHGELPGLMHHAELKYAEALAAGDVHAEQINPARCAAKPHDPD